MCDTKLASLQKAKVKFSPSCRHRTQKWNPTAHSYPTGGEFSPQRWLFSSVFPHREEEMINKCLNTFYWRPFADYYVWLKYLKQGSDRNIIYFLPSNRAQCENLASEREFIFRLQNTMQIKEITTCWKRALNQLVTDEINGCSRKSSTTIWTAAS